MVNFSEIYKPAIEAYSVLHNVDKNLNLGDITKIDPTNIPDFDLMTYGFPCTSLSILNQKSPGGLSDMKRSGLFYEAMRIVKEKKPKYLLAENVPALLWRDKGSQMKLVTDVLDELGYRSEYKILNSSYFGSPQNRKRVYIMSIRKDIDYEFHFPEQIERTDRQVRDIVDFNIKDRKLHKLLVDKIKEKIPIPERKLSIYDVRDPKDPGWVICELYSIYNISPTLIPQDCMYFYEIGGTLKGKEKMLLQGFSVADYDRIKDFISEPQFSLLTGNTITVSVLESIFRNLFKDMSQDL